MKWPQKPLHTQSLGKGNSGTGGARQKQQPPHLAPQDHRRGQGSQQEPSSCPFPLASGEPKPRAGLRYTRGWICDRTICNHRVLALALIAPRWQ